MVVQRATGRGRGQDAEAAAEPVDMSINNSAPEHDERLPVPHCPNAGPAEFCPCSKGQLPMVSFFFFLCLSVNFQRKEMPR